MSKDLQVPQGIHLFPLPPYSPELQPAESGLSDNAGRISIGWVSGDTARQVSVSDFDWKRLGQFTASKVQSIRRATGLLVSCPQRLSVCAALSR